MADNTLLKETLETLLQSPVPSEPGTVVYVYVIDGNGGATEADGTALHENTHRVNSTPKEWHYSKAINPSLGRRPGVHLP